MGSAARPRPSSPPTSLISLDDALAMGQDAWNGMAGASPFASWEWTMAWRTAAPPARRSLAVAVTRPGILLPLRKSTGPRGRWHSLVTDLGCPDHLDVLGGGELDGLLNGAFEAGATSVALEGLADQGRLRRELLPALDRDGGRFRLKVQDYCPMVALAESWHAYLQRLSTERRQWIRRKERRALAAGVTFVDHGASDFDAGFDALVALHACRWSDGGVFSDPRLVSLVRDASRRLFERDATWLTTAWLAGQPIGAWLGFGLGDTVSFYQSGRDLRQSSLSIGAVLMGRMIRLAHERGFRNFDFLRGSEAYKAGWGATPEPIWYLEVYSDGVRGRALQAAHTARRWATRVSGHLRGVAGRGETITAGESAGSPEAP